MSTNEPRPLPPRALPPLQTVHGTQPQPTRTPRKKPRQTKLDGSASSTTGGRTRRPSGKPRGQRSPRNQDSETVSEQRALPQLGDVNDQQNEGPQSERRIRPKRRKQRTASNQGDSDGAGLENGNNISSLLNEDDIVEVEKIEEAVILTNLPGVAAGAGGSAPTDKVYVQTTNGFASHTQDWIRERNKVASNAARVTYGDDIIRSSHIASQNERAFMFLTLLIHGLLSGFSIWQVVVSYSLLGSGENNFLTQYKSLAGPTQTVYYIILILCTVSAMDRYDFAAPDKHIIRSLGKFDMAAIAVVVYWIGLLFSVGMAGLDAWLGSDINIPVSTTVATITETTVAPLPAELTGENLDASTTINTWLILNVFRAVFSCLGWLIIAYDPLRNDMQWDEST